MPKQKNKSKPAGKRPRQQSPWNKAVATKLQRLIDEAEEKHNRHKKSK